MRVNSDTERIEWLTCIVLLPLVLSFIWLSAFMRVEYMPLTPIVGVLLSCVFMALMYAYEPHLKHWRKAINEFDKNYRYEKEGASE